VKSLKIIERALCGGGRLHAFRSGGGLRVIRIEKGKRGKLLAYGEAPTIDEALRIAADDFEAGVRPYNEVYGKIEEHYLTGAYAADDPLDVWVCRGRNFDAWHDGERFVVELTYLEDAQEPPGTVERVCNGETIEWTDARGVTYRASPSRFPNGERSCSISIVSKPDSMPHHRAWMYYARRTGTGETLTEAIDAAFVAKSVELEKDP
jgi:hypothetical protein